MFWRVDGRRDAHRRGARTHVFYHHLATTKKLGHDLVNVGFFWVWSISCTLFFFSLPPSSHCCSVASGGQVWGRSHSILMNGLMT
jgi:hypothetical protein